MTVKELKSLCRQKGLPVSGQRAQLIKRLAQDTSMTVTNEEVVEIEGLPDSSPKEMYWPSHKELQYTSSQQNGDASRHTWTSKASTQI